MLERLRAALFMDSDPKGPAGLVLRFQFGELALPKGARLVEGEGLASIHDFEHLQLPAIVVFSTPPAPPPELRLPIV